MIVQAALYRFFLLLAFVAGRLPRGWVLAIAAAFGHAVYALYRLTPVRGFIAGNLRAALPDAPAAAIARRHVVGLARCIAEILRFPRVEAVRFEGWEHVEAARAAGNGVIILTAHYGNWELLGAALVAHGLPLHVLVQPPSQDAFGRLFVEFRARVGVRTWPNTGKASLRPALRALQANEGLGLLADQHGEAQEALVRFFGHTVSAPTGPIFLAQRTGAALLPVHLVRQPDGSHVGVVEPAIAPVDDVQATAQRMYDHYERWITEHPDHWLWAHDRWARGRELGYAPTLVRAGAPA